MKKTLVLTIVSILILLCFMAGCSSNKNQDTTPTKTTTSTATPEGTSTTEPEVTPPDPTAIYTVRVVDENNTPISGATVRLCIGNIYKSPVYTNSQGVATVTADKAEYTVKVTLSGYNGEAEYLFAAGSTELTIQLTKATPLTLTNIAVSTGENATEVYAGTELVSYLNKKGIVATENGFPISIAIDSSLGDDCFVIEADVEENLGMTIRGGNGRGVLYGVYRFLQEYAGFRYFTYDLETYTDDDVVIFSGVLMEYTPVMSARRLTWLNGYYSSEWNVKVGVNFGVTLPEELGGACYNYGNLFVHTLGRLSDTTYPYPDYATNPCMTDPEVLATVIKNVRKELESNPDINIVSISQNDVEAWCHCPNCTKIEEEEGSSSGPLLRFVNAVAEDLVKDYPDIIVDTLAYKYTQKAPKITKPHPNVCIRLCSITCCFTHAIDDPNCEQNKTFCEDLVAWSKICDNIHIWDYTTNYYYYMSTFANLDVIQKNMRFFADHNVVSMFPQGNGQGASGEFGELRAYLLAQLMWDPYMTEETYRTHMDEFLAAYYGEGWTYIRDYIDKTSQFAANGGFKINEDDETEGSPVCGQGIYDHPLTVITRQEYLNFEYLFDEYWALAEELAGDRVEYVKRSMFQWRFAKLYIKPNAEEAQRLIDDAKAAGVVWKQGDHNVLPESDLTLSPYFWKYGK